jgi:hypothetical protein
VEGRIAPLGESWPEKLEKVTKKKVAKSVVLLKKGRQIFCGREYGPPVSKFLNTPLMVTSLSKLTAHLSGKCALHTALTVLINTNYTKIFDGNGYLAIYNMTQITNDC